MTNSCKEHRKTGWETLSHKINLYFCYILYKPFISLRILSAAQHSNSPCQGFKLALAQWWCEWLQYVRCYWTSFLIERFTGTFYLSDNNITSNSSRLLIDLVDRDNPQCQQGIAATSLLFHSSSLQLRPKSVISGSVYWCTQCFLTKVTVDCERWMSVCCVGAV